MICQQDKILRPFWISNHKSAENVFADYDANKLYWVDSALKYLGVSNLDGSGRKHFLEGLLYKPFGVVVYEDQIFWTQWTSTEAVKKTSKTSPTTAETVVTKADTSQDTAPFAIVVSRSTQTLQCEIC